MADKKVNKISKTKIVKAGSKASPKIADKKGITEGPEKRVLKSQKRDRRVRRVSVPSKSSVHSVIKKSPPRLSVPAFDINGRSLGTVSLPKEIFGQKPNKRLLAQAIRIYSTNQSTHWASTKTRSEVRGGGRKPWRQKGTGRARAGSIRSPIWVGGGVALGPKYRKVILSLPKKMRKRALISAFSLKVQAGSIKVISNIEKIQAKTKIIANVLKKLDAQGNCLLVISDNPPNDGQSLRLASRNIQGVSVNRLANLNAYEVIKNKNILFSKEALGGLRWD